MPTMTMISTRAQQVAEMADARARDGFALVALDGLGGSGKSSLAAALVEVRGAVVVHGDDFYRPMDPEERAALDPVQGYHRYFDWQRLREEVLAPLTAGREAAYRRYDWETGTLAPDEIHTVPCSGIVVVEGVYCARPELAEHYDLLVYVDTSREESMRRLRARGHDHGPIDWESRWRLAEEHYLAAIRPRERAHLVVPGY